MSNHRIATRHGAYKPERVNLELAAQLRRLRLIAACGGDREQAAGVERLIRLGALLDGRK